MFAAVARVSAEDGFASEAARDEFCEHVGGGAARLCMAATAAGSDAPRELDALGAALERALLAGAPSVRSGMRRLPAPASEPAGGAGHGGPGAGSGPIAEERARAHEALAEAVRDTPSRAEPAVLVYRTLAHLQLAALAAALRKPAGVAPSTASISPIRKLWIAWRASRGTDRDDL